MNRDDRPATGQAVWTRVGFIHLSCLSLPRPARNKTGEKMSNYDMWEKIFGESPPDYLLEETVDQLKRILKTKNKELQGFLFEEHILHLKKAKGYLRKAHIDVPDLRAVDDFLKNYYAYIDGLERWFRNGQTKGPDPGKLLALENQRDSLFNRECVFYHAQEKQLTQELNDKQTTSGRKKEGKPKSHPDAIVSLVEFMKQQCKPYTGIDYKARRDALYKAHSRGTIKLPKPARRPAKGRAHVYHASKLHKNWREFSRQIPLPPLQSAEN